ncbi:MAG: manganese efflux pump [Planctomycetota bacterium]
MTPVETVVLALVLAIDAFVVGAALGLHHRSRWQIVRLALGFGAASALLPILGAISPSAVYQLIILVGDWAVFILLLYLGFRLIRDSFSKKDVPAKRDLTRGWALLALSVAVGIDALTAGYSHGAEEMVRLFPLAMIGGVAAMAAMLGMLLSRRAGPRMGRWGGILAGLILIGIGFKVLVEYFGG